jgi:hypothetical protein
MLGKTFAERQREQKGADYDYDVAKLKRRIAELEAALRGLIQVSEEALGRLDSHDARLVGGEEELKAARAALVI